MDRASSLLLGTLDSWDPSYSELEGSLEVTSLRLFRITSLIHSYSIQLHLLQAQLGLTGFHGIQLISSQHATNQTQQIQLNPTQTNESNPNELISTHCVSPHIPSRRKRLSKDMEARLLAQGSMGMGGQ